MAERKNIEPLTTVLPIVGLDVGAFGNKSLSALAQAEGNLLHIRNKFFAEGLPPQSLAKAAAGAGTPRLSSLLVHRFPVQQLPVILYLKQLLSSIMIEWGGAVRVLQGGTRELPFSADRVIVQVV